MIGIMPVQYLKAGRTRKADRSENAVFVFRLW
jgi:hypothetical protein